MRWPLLAAAAVIAAAALQTTRAGGPVPRARAEAPSTRHATAAALPCPAPSEPAGEAPAPAADPTPLDDLRSALAARDPDAMARAADALAAWVLGDESRALVLVEAFRAEADPTAMELLALTLADDARAAAWYSVGREMLSAARGDPLADRRRAALSYLARSGTRSAEIEADASWIARSDSDPLVRSTAFELLGAIAASDGSAAARLHPMLLAEASRASDPSLRIAALQAIDPARASEEVLRAIRDIGGADPDADVRQEAAARAGP